MDDPKAQILDKLRSANNILVTVSASPTVDQLSAAIGVTLLLNRMNKDVTAVFSGKVPPVLNFLKPKETFVKTTDSLRDFIIALDKSKADKLRYKVEDDVVKIYITPYKATITEKDLQYSAGDFNVDFILALGVQHQQDLDKAITAHGQVLHDAVVMSINNRPGGDFGVANWENLDASSLSEQVTDLAMSLDPSLLDQTVATALLTGIVAETSRFSNDKTHPQTMAISSSLLQAGADQQLVNTELQDLIGQVVTYAAGTQIKPTEVMKEGDNHPVEELVVTDKGDLVLADKDDAAKPQTDSTEPAENADTADVDQPAASEEATPAETQTESSDEPASPSAESDEKATDDSATDSDEAPQLALPAEGGEAESDTSDDGDSTKSDSNSTATADTEVSTPEPDDVSGAVEPVSGDQDSDIVEGTVANTADETNESGQNSAHSDETTIESDVEPAAAQPDQPQSDAPDSNSEAGSRPVPEAEQVDETPASLFGNESQASTDTEPSQAVENTQPAELDPADTDAARRAVEEALGGQSNEQPHPADVEPPQPAVELSADVSEPPEVPQPPQADPFVLPADPSSNLGSPVSAGAPAIHPIPANQPSYASPFTTTQYDAPNPAHEPAPLNESPADQPFTMPLPPSGAAGQAGFQANPAPGFTMPPAQSTTPPPPPLPPPLPPAGQ